MNDMKTCLTRQQFLATAGLAGLALGTSACAAYGRTTATPATSTAVAEAPIAATADVPVGSGVIVDDIVITQPNTGDFRGFSAVCTHAGCTLADVSEGTINCPCHGSKFNLDGTVANGPAARPLEAKAIKVNGDSIVAR